MSAHAWNGVLHTNSAYFNGKYGTGSVERQEYYKPANINQDFENAYTYAKEQELQFYHQYYADVNSFSEFITRIRKLFNDAQGDGARIRGLSNANLSPYVPDSVVSVPINYTVAITGDISSKISFDELASKNVVVKKGKTLYINVDQSSIGLIKQIINEGLGQKRFNTESSNMKNIRNYFSNLIENNTEQIIGNNITITSDAPKKSSSMNTTGSIAFEKGGFPFKWKKSEVQQFLNGEFGLEARAKFEQEFKKALIEIKHFIFNTCLQVQNGTLYNGKNLLQEAAQQAWDSIVGTGNLMTQTFFFEGKNLTKSVLGNGGEFQLEVMKRYIDLVMANTNPALGQLIGSTIKDNRQQPRSDYQIIMDLGGDIGTTILGIQVKNVNPTSLEQIDINTDLDLVAPNLDNSLVDTIANVYFNTDIAQMAGDIKDFLSKYLHKYFWKSMNLNVGSNLNPTHTNTFYWVSGTSIVPASEIISTIKNSSLIENPEFTIDSPSVESHSDKDFLADDGGDPLFTRWWHGNDNIGWDPLFANYGLYQKLISQVRIHTSFNIAQVLNNGQTFELLI